MFGRRGTIWKMLDDVADVVSVTKPKVEFLDATDRHETPVDPHTRPARMN
jgi:hypothetical protein